MDHRRPFLLLPLLALTALLLFSGDRPANADDKFHGLLQLPPLCAQPCPGSDQPLPLYQAPYQQDSENFISRDLYYQENANIQNRENPLWPVTMDYEGDKAAAVVFERVDGTAYKIKIRPYDYWVKASDAGPFMPYPDLLKGRLAYLDRWDFLLWDRPAGDLIHEIDHIYRQDPDRAKRIPVRYLKSRKIGGTIWMQIEVLEHSPCITDRRELVAKGWLPAYKENGTQAAWYDPKGC